MCLNFQPSAVFSGAHEPNILTQHNASETFALGPWGVGVDPALPAVGVLADRAAEDGAQFLLPPSPRGSGAVGLVAQADSGFAS